MNNGVDEKFTKSFRRNTILNFLMRTVGMGFGLVLVPLNISYLGSVLYGLWMTIASISHWANIGDFGISNGLRNELAKAIASDDYLKQRCLIRTAIILLSKISILIFFVLTIVSESLITTDIIDAELRYPLYITNLFFCISFVTGIARTVAYAYQKSWLSTFAQMATSGIQIIIVAILLYTPLPPNLVLFSIVNGIATVLGNIIIIIFLKKSLTRIIPNILDSRYEAKYKAAILNVGLKFFILQLSCLVLYTTDNVIINKILDSTQVTKYSVITTIYTTGENLFSLILISLWSAVTFAAEKNDYRWIKKEVLNTLKVWIVFCLGVVIVAMLFNDIVHIWLGDNAMHYEYDILITFSLYTIIGTFGSIFVNVTNGLGRLKPQIICSVIGAFLNIPLSVYLCSYCGLGLSGIKLATFICLFGSNFVVPFDIIRFLKNK